MKTITPPMMKTQIILCFALVLSGGFGIRADESATNAEPRYLDKSLSEWIPLSKFVGDVGQRADLRAYDAVRNIGTNALPWLLQWIHSENSETARLGIEGFRLLGPIANPVVSELARQVNDWPSSSDWKNAIPALTAIQDPYPLTLLLSAATNMTAPVELRLQVVQSIGVYNAIVISATNAVIPVLIHCLQDKDWRMAAAAAHGLAFYHFDPIVEVPALSDCFESSSNMQVRLSVMHALLIFCSHYSYSAHDSIGSQYRETMRRLVPVLIKALSDEDWRVASMAATSLGTMKLEPNLAVPALIKSLDDPPRRDVRQEVIDALGNFGTAAQSAEPALTKIAQADPDGYIGGGSVASALKKIVPQTKP
jgi:hypothetical protein